MTQVAEVTTPFLSNFSTTRKSTTGIAPAWLARLHQAGLAEFDRVGFPNSKSEEWRFTNITAIAKTAFKPAPRVELPPAAIAEHRFGNQAAIELVFVNGHFDLSLSQMNSLPRGVTVLPLADAVAKHSELLEKNLGGRARIEKNPFVAMNTGLFEDGAVIHLARNASLELPIHLLFVSVPDAMPTATHPRVLIVAEDNSEATIAESFVSLEGAGGPFFDNVVTELVAGQDCRLDHYVLQREATNGFHISTTELTLGRSSRFVSHAATIGAKLSRNNVNVLLAGEFADATLNGLVLIGGDQHCDNHTFLEHAAPNCPSYELYKHVLKDKSTAVFKGKIHVHQIAQKTDAKQTSKALLLSDDAVMNSQPALEIYADDVKCTHGSTIGPVDDDMIFYLRSRGVSEDAAKHLLSYAFAADVTRRIKVQAVRERIESVMAAQHGLPQDLRISDLGSHDDAAR